MVDAILEGYPKSKKQLLVGVYCPGGVCPGSYTHMHSLYGGGTHTHTLFSQP